MRDEAFYEEKELVEGMQQSLARIKAAAEGR